MVTFARELSQSILSDTRFLDEFNALRRAGILASLSGTFGATAPIAPEALARLVEAASVFSTLDGECLEKDVGQQIAIFTNLVTESDTLKEASRTVLAHLGNFPALEFLRGSGSRDSLRGALQQALLEEMNRVPVGMRHVSLTDFQMRIWSGLQRPESTAFSAPTSAGKSFLVLEHLCARAKQAESFLAIYIAPTRALLSEVRAKLERRFAEASIAVRVTSVPLLATPDVPKQIFVLTQERLQVLLGELVAQRVIDVVVVDEAQSLGVGSRGMILQHCLQTLARTQRVIRFLFLAPGVSGFGAVSRMLGIEAVKVDETRWSPVVQNRISVTLDGTDEHRIDLHLLTEKGAEHIASVVTERGLAIRVGPARVAAVALELGAGGHSLVYATGAARAEETAGSLVANRAAAPGSTLNELRQFIRTHIHTKYSLGRYVKHGIAFHYGNMPALLREGIESAFRKGEIEYLVCTTTLFHGINLPARNVFIDTPTRGNQQEALDPGDLWNFAGRAGRLGDEAVGNVFLVGYPEWPVHPFDRRASVPMSSSFADAVQSQGEAVVDFFRRARGGDRAEDISTEAKAAAGLLLLRASQGGADAVLRTTALNAKSRARLSAEATDTVSTLGLSSEILASSWTVSPVGLSAMLQRLRRGVHDGEVDSLLPTNPSLDGGRAYRGIVFRLYKYLGGLNLRGKEQHRTRQYIGYVAGCATAWMLGKPMRKLVADSVKYEARKAGVTISKLPQKKIDSAVRKTFDLVETTLRFKLVQWSKAYVELLRLALREGEKEDIAEQVYDFSLALELGVSTQTGRSLVELGLSRMTAVAVADLLADSSLTVDDVLAWLQSDNPALAQLSAPMRVELEALRLAKIMV